MKSRHEERAAPSLAPLSPSLINRVRQFYYAGGIRERALACDYVLQQQQPPKEVKQVTAE